MTDRTERAIRENNALWDEWTDLHVGSAFYDLDGFRRGGIRLSPEAPLRGGSAPHGARPLAGRPRHDLLSEELAKGG